MTSPRPSPEGEGVLSTDPSLLTIFRNSSLLAKATFLACHPEERWIFALH
jgi:hypothetical protein